MSRFLKWVMVLAATVFVSSVATLVVMGMGGLNSTPAALQQDANVEGLRLPAFSLTDQHGRAVTRGLFEGEVTVLTFMFSHCPFACPTLTRGMWEMQGALSTGTSSRVRFASITVDPVHDTPERLMEYAKGNDADLSRWAFLTGDMKTIRDICTTSLKFGLADDPTASVKLPDGSEMANISHPTRFVLIGPEGQVLAIFGSDQAGKMACVQRAAAAASLKR